MKPKLNTTLKEVAAHLLEQVPLASLEEALVQLPEDMGQVLHLYFFEQLTVQEISEKIRRSPTTAGKKIRQGCYFLEKHFDTPSYRQAKQILYGKQPNRISY